MWLTWLDAELHLDGIFYEAGTVFSLVVFSALLRVSFSAVFQGYFSVKAVVITGTTLCLSYSCCSWALACTQCHRFDHTICLSSFVFPVPELCFPQVCNFFQTAFGNVRSQHWLFPCLAVVSEFLSPSFGFSSLWKDLAFTDLGLILNVLGVVLSSAESAVWQSHLISFCWASCRLQCLPPCQAWKAVWQPFSCSFLSFQIGLHFVWQLLALVSLRFISSVPVHDNDLHFYCSFLWEES